MPILYVRTGCGYCAKVLHAAEAAGIELVLKNIGQEGVTEELIALGGKPQVPYLVDEDRGVAMYESDDIIDYLHQTFSPDSVV